MHDAQLFKSNPNVEIAYVCDCDAARLANAAKEFGIAGKGATSDMRRVLDDKSFASRLGAAAGQKVAGRFSVEHMARAYEEVYLELAGAR